MTPQNGRFLCRILLQSSPDFLANFTDKETRDREIGSKASRAKAFY
jgi:hypothetical protein